MAKVLVEGYIIAMAAGGSFGGLEVQCVAIMPNAGMMKIHGLPQVHLYLWGMLPMEFAAGSGGGSTHRAGGGAGGGAIELAADGDGKIHITTTGSILAMVVTPEMKITPRLQVQECGGAIKLSEHP